MENFFKFITNAKFRSILDQIVLVVIIIAGIVVGLETSKNIKDNYGFWLHLMDSIILGIFVVEIFVKVLGERNRPWRYFYDSWQVFDFIIVVLCFLPLLMPESNTQFFAVFRLARILRLARIFDKIHSLKILLLSLVKSLPKMSYVVILLLLLYYIYGVIGTDLFQKSNSKYESLTSTMTQLFFVTFEGMSGHYEDLTFIPKEVDEEKPSGFKEAITLPNWIVFLYFMSFLFMSAMIFLNLFIGIITSDMESVRNEESRGKRHIYKKGHTVILGWSLSVFKIVEELIEANKSKERANIVILADMPKEDMDFEIKNAFPKTATTKIICRSGASTELANLEMINLSSANSVIILTDNNNPNSDVDALKTIIAITNNNETNENLNIICDMNEPNYKKIASSINDNIIFFDSDDFISRLIAQTCLQPRLSQIYSEITGFQGSEIYLSEANLLIEKDYSDILLQYNSSCPIGIFRDNHAIINPEMNTKIQKDDKLIIIAEDDSTIKITNKTYQFSNISNPKKSTGFDVENILILGSNKKLPKIIQEVNSYLSKTISLKVITHQDYSFRDTVEYFKSQNQQISVSENFIFKLSNLEVEFILGDIEDEKMLSRYAKNADHITILSYYDEFLDIQKADTITLVALIHLRKLLSENNNTSITTEIIDDNNRQLIKNDNVRDFIVSSNIISSIISQLSENPELQEVFATLFKADGSEIYLRNAVNYFKVGESVTFAEIVKSCFTINETAIGYLKCKQDKMCVNPKKDTIFAIEKEDMLIVLAEE